MGIEEVRAFETVSVALEAGIIEGEYRPGAPGWRAKAAEITRRTLDEQVRPVRPTDLRRYRRLDLVLGSRVEDWVVSARDPRHRQLREAVAGRLLDGPAAVAPVPPPAGELDAALRPLIWLLETCRDGVRATSAGYLEPAVVRAAAAELGWWPFDDQPRSEVDVFKLVLLHEMATRNRWLLRRSKRITTTKPALRLLQDPVRLWSAVMGTVGQADDYFAMLSELIAIRLLDGPAEDIGLYGPSELALFVSEVMLGQGWQSGRTPSPNRTWPATSIGHSGSGGSSASSMIHR